MPWCVRKCPYCDFNSHAVPDGQLSMDLEQQYLTALVADFETQVEMAQGRLIHSVFIGGGTPSLISAQGYHFLIYFISIAITLAQDIQDNGIGVAANKVVGNGAAHFYCTSFDKRYISKTNYRSGRAVLNPGRPQGLKCFGLQDRQYDHDEHE